MIKMIASANVISGVLKNYETVGTDLVVRLELTNMHTVDVTFPNIPTGILDAMKRLGIEKLKNATININAGQVTLGDKVETKKPTTNSIKSSERRPGMKMVRGGIV